MFASFRPAISMFVALTLVTGVIYPSLVTGVSQWLFPFQANGSIVSVGGAPAGSALIGQQFTSPGYFWSRLSATGPHAYNGAASSGSNLGPLNPALHEAVQGRIAALRAADPGNDAPVPVDLATASASGLDPDISLAAAYYQAARVARARGLSPVQVEELIEAHGVRPWLGVFGEPRVNVLALNLALDARD